MTSGRDWSWWRPVGPGLLLWLLAGCAVGKSQFDQNLMADKASVTRNQGVVESYVVHCPDVLHVTFAGRPDLGGRCPVGPDGRIDLGPLGRPRVEGQTPAAAAARVAAAAGVSPGQVGVQVAEFKSQQVYLFGEVIGLQRALPYQGPETVLDLLQRVGGVTRGAAADDVYVVRPHVAEGRPPEVFHIDLRAIVMTSNYHTNLRLQPFDQVYVGESRSSNLAKCIPPCLRPVYDALWGLRRAEAEHPSGGARH